MKNKLCILSACAILSATTSAAFAAPILLDFEGFAAGQVIDSEYAGLGVTITTISNGANNHGVIFDSRQLNAGEDDADLVGPFDDETTAGHDNFEPGNILIISDDDGRITCDGISCTPADDEALGGSITFDFDSGFDISMTSIDIFDINNGEQAADVSFFDNSGLLIGMTILLGNTGADNTYRTIDLTGIIGVRRMVVNLYGSGAIDNLRFDAIPNPIPGAIPLMLTGLVAGGISMRRKKKAA